MVEMKEYHNLKGTFKVSHMSYWFRLQAGEDSSGSVVGRINEK
jgi:hypothetical protein